MAKKKATKKAKKHQHAEPSKLLKDFADWTIRNVSLVHNVGHLREELQAQRDEAEEGEDAPWKADDLDEIEEELEVLGLTDEKGLEAWIIEATAADYAILRAPKRKKK